MHPFSLKCFGVGDGWPCADRNHSAFLYRFGREHLLFDCGETVDRGYKAAGYSYDAIDHLFLSHFHADHFGGLFMLMQGFWLEKRQKDLPIHLPAEGLEPLRQMLNVALLFEELFSCRVSFEPLAAGRPVQTRAVQVTPFLTTHLDGFRSRFGKKYALSFEAFSFLLEAEGRRIVHSADLGQPEDLDPLLARPVDLLVCELAHFRPEAIFEYLRGKPIGKVIFVHLARRYWKSLAATRELAEKTLGDIPVVFAHDNEEFTL